VYHPDDTIAAIASAPGGAARGIVRLSGPSTVGCLQPLFTADEQSLDLRDVRAPRAVSGWLRLGGFASTLPCDIYLWPGPQSYTRQLAAEIHTFGSPPLLAAALRELCEQGARLAQPGEFTLRAFLAGRLDLTQAEAVLGVIDASDRRELDAALSQLAGGLGGELRALRDRLLDLLARLEAGLDFVEEDIEFISAAELQRELDEAQAVVAGLVANIADRGETAEWIRVVLTGWPNVGKSSLFNALAGKDRAIVSPQPGATRDYLGARLQIGGLACELIDTAGVEPAPATAISAAAQEASAEQRRQARLELWCLDSTRPPNAWERAKLSQAPDRASVLIVLTKTDDPRRRLDFEGGIETSSATGKGIERLRARIYESLVASSRPDGGAMLSSAVRCRDSLRRAAEDLERALDVVRSGGGEELVAAELRIALDHLGQVVGAVYTDDVLDRVFSRFCIGK